MIKAEQAYMSLTLHNVDTVVVNAIFNGQFITICPGLATYTAGLKIRVVLLRWCVSESFTRGCWFWRR